MSTDQEKQCFADLQQITIRKGELRDLLWENYDGEQVLVSQSFWRGHRLDPKNRQSKAPVPVIEQLIRGLNWHRQNVRQAPPTD